MLVVVFSNFISFKQFCIPIRSVSFRENVTFVGVPDIMTDFKFGFNIHKID